MAAPTRAPSRRPRSAAAAAYTSSSAFRSWRAASSAGSVTDATTTVCRAVSCGSTESRPRALPGRVDRGQQHDERVPVGDPAHVAGHRRPVGLDELGLDARHGVDHAGEQLGAGRAVHPAAHAPVPRDEVDAVAGVRGEGAEQQRGLERRVEARLVVDAGGGGARGVDDDHDAAVALRTPGAHHEPLLPGTSGSTCRAVARQSIERTSSPRTYSRIESNSVPWPRMSSGVRPSSSRRRVSRDGRCSAGVERRQHADAARRGERRLAGPESERPRRADRDLLRASIAATERGELQ